MTTHSKGTTDGLTLRTVVTDVVLEVAPEERPVLLALTEVDDATVTVRLTGRRRDDEPLAFGAELVTALVTPVVWIAVDEAIRRIVDSAADHAKLATRERRFPFLRRRRAEPVVIPPLTRDQLVIVEQSVLDSAREAGLPDDHGSRIADCVIRRIALGATSLALPNPAAEGVPAQTAEPGPSPEAAS